MNNKEKGDIKTPEEIIWDNAVEAVKVIYLFAGTKPGAEALLAEVKQKYLEEYKAKFKPQPLPEDVKDFIQNIIHGNGTSEYCSPLYSAQQYKDGNCPKNDVEAAIRSSLEFLYSTYVTESRNQIESLQKELVVEKERLEKEKRQLLIQQYCYKHPGTLEIMAKRLKATPDEIRVAIFEADLMIKEFLKK